MPFILRDKFESLDLTKWNLISGTFVPVDNGIRSQGYAARIESKDRFKNFYAKIKLTPYNYLNDAGNVAKIMFRYNPLRYYEILITPTELAFVVRDPTKSEVVKRLEISHPQGQEVTVSIQALGQNLIFREVARGRPYIVRDTTTVEGTIILGVGANGIHDLNSILLVGTPSGGLQLPSP